MIQLLKNHQFHLLKELITTHTYLKAPSNYYLLEILKLTCITNHLLKKFRMTHSYLKTSNLLKMLKLTYHQIRLKEFRMIHTYLKMPLNSFGSMVNSAKIANILYISEILSLTSLLHSDRTLEPSLQ